MKKITILLIAVIMSLTACSSDENSTLPIVDSVENKEIALMTANVNGQDFDNLQPRTFSTFGKMLLQLGIMEVFLNIFNYKGQMIQGFH